MRILAVKRLSLCLIFCYGFLSYVFGDWVKVHDDKKEPAGHSVLNPALNAVNLTSKQRDDIRTIQADFSTKIDRLVREITKLRNHEKLQIEKHLTRDQMDKIRKSNGHVLVGAVAEIPVGPWIDSELKKLTFGDVQAPTGFKQEDLREWAKNKAHALSTPDDILLFLGLHYAKRKLSSVSVFITEVDGHRISADKSIHLYITGQTEGVFDPKCDIHLRGYGEPFKLSRCLWTVHFRGTIDTIDNRKYPPKARALIGIKVQIRMDESRSVYESMIPVELTVGTKTTVAPDRPVQK